MSHELNSSFVIKTIFRQCNCLLSSVATDIVRPTFQVLVLCLQKSQKYSDYGSCSLMKFVVYELRH